MNDLIDACLSYIAHGFKVFPVKTDKKPLTAHGLKDATQTQAGVREHWTRWPDAGIASVAEGLMVLDFDSKNGGIESKTAMRGKRYPAPGHTTKGIKSQGAHAMEVMSLIRGKTVRTVLLSALASNRADSI